MSTLPKGRPKLSQEDANKIVTAKLGATAPKLVLIGIRGYYSNSMGPTKGNDINIYDDAMIVVGSKYATFNANTDPSFVKRRNRVLAKLKTGNYKYYKGKHKNRYNALRPFPEGVDMPCTRDGKDSTAKYTNIHMGGTGGTDVVWSEGCQTIPKTQWAKFIELVYEEMNKHGLKTVDYILIDADEMSNIIK